MPKSRGGPERPAGAPEKMTFSSIEDLRDPIKGPEIDRRLKAFAISLTKDTQWAKDVVSITYEKATSAADRGLFEEGTEFMSWLYKIAQNAWIDQTRTMAAQGFIISFDTDEAAAHDAGKLGITEPHQHREAESRQQLQVVRDAIKTLPPEEQELIELVSDGISYARMAEIQNVPIGTVMSRLSRARRRLRELTGWGTEESDEE